MKTARNNVLELIKLFASYMVVFIHLPFYGKAALVMESLARFAVPFFILVSGFFSYRISLSKIKKRILHMLSLLLFSVLLYTWRNIEAFVLSGNFKAIGQYFGRYLSSETLTNLLVFNVPVSSVHLWYLLAMLYVYIIFFFVTKYSVSEKPLFVLSFILLFANLILGEGLSAMGIIIPNHYIRNFALVGMPFFGIGMFVKKHEMKFKSVPGFVIFLCMAVGIAETLFSRFNFGINDMYLGSVFIVFAFAVTFIKLSDLKCPRPLITLASCSTFIYILHMFVSSKLFNFYWQAGLDYQSLIWLKNLHPILACVISTILAYVVILIQKGFKAQKAEAKAR